MHGSADAEAAERKASVEKEEQTNSDVTDKPQGLRIA